MRLNIIATAALISLGLPTSDASAEERSSPQQAASTARASIAELEKAFWHCDYIGTHSQVDSETGIVCAALTEQLKLKKFNGDYDALVVWWQTNKPAQHSAHRAAGAPAQALLESAPARFEARQPQLR